MTGTDVIRERAVELYGEGVLRRSALGIRGGAGAFEWALAGKGIRRVLEIGTYKGVSAAAISQYVEPVTTIDLVRGRLEHTDPSFDREEFWRSMGIGNITQILIGNDAEKKAIVDALDFDFAFVDGAHDATVRNDFELVKRCGLVLFHDAADNRKRGFNENASNHVYEFVSTLPPEQLQFNDIFCLWTAPGLN